MIKNLAISEKQISRAMADWEMDFRATIPYLICIWQHMCRYLHLMVFRLSEKYDTGVAMVVKED